MSGDGPGGDDRGWKNEWWAGGEEDNEQNEDGEGNAAEEARPSWYNTPLHHQHRWDGKTTPRLFV